MNITKSQLKKIIAEELANEGIADFFGSKKKKEFGYKWHEMPFHEMTPAEQEKYKSDWQEKRHGEEEEKKSIAQASAASEKAEKKREEEEALAKHRRKVAAMDPKQRDRYLGHTPQRDPVHSHPGFSVAAEGKITKSDLVQIVREELEAIMSEKGASNV